MPADPVNDPQAEYAQMVLNFEQSKSEGAILDTLWEELDLASEKVQQCKEALKATVEHTDLQAAKERVKTLKEEIGTHSERTRDVSPAA